MTNVKKSVLTAVSIALCVVLPMAFHSIPNAGAVYLPMHVPVLVCGLLCGWQFGLLCGLAGPLLSSLLAGMPPAAILPIMMIELASYGLVSGFLMRTVRTGKTAPDLYIALVIAMIAGRVVSGIAKALIFMPGKMTVAAWVSGYFIVSLPGIAIQLALVPAAIFALMKAGLVPVRYSSRAGE
ncbi:MAG TPA: ECF transporter S component [Treponemataceae bacterium]|nr:ECF transporter S component [Treponemataceae bacterium]HQL34012.1 ECF transporter S component [Treponemataceae bacterium]